MPCFQPISGLIHFGQATLARVLPGYATQQAGVSHAVTDRYALVGSESTATTAPPPCHGCQRNSSARKNKKNTTPAKTNRGILLCNKLGK
ncbi:MAG TPA: hypothetical protein VJC18_08335 [bacterium]|nr:hypothetical protein [bacterium]